MKNGTHKWGAVLELFKEGTKLKLDSRLSAVAELVRGNSTLADIGTDHAYLPVYLIQNNIIKSAIASDIGKGPLENARKTVEKYGFTDKIQLRLSDGLKKFRPNEVNEISVAGMGGLLISQFINETEWFKSEEIHLILQPMTHTEDLRKALYDNGFYIDKELVAKDTDKLYIVLSAYYSGEKYNYSEFDLIVGKLPLNSDELSKEYLNKIFVKYNKKLIALKDADKECADLENLVEELKQWQL